jgi:hypothetical protein
MNFYWARSNNFLLVFLAIAVALVGVLITLVIHQQDDQSAVDGQVRVGTVPTVPAASVPAGAEIVAHSNAVDHSDPATTSEAANAPVGPASQLAPASPGPQVAPALVAPAPRITPPQFAPSPLKPLKPTTLPHRRVNPVPAPRPPVAVQPVAPAPQTIPGTATKSDNPVKPGSPDGNW